MRRELKFLSLWAINGTLKLEELRRQLCELKELGFDGVIFHPRNYPESPAYLSGLYMEILSELILYAKEIQMEFWIYDENGWPSGSANGMVLEQYQECVCQWLEYEQGEVRICSRKAVNTLDKKAMDLFIEITYEGYRKGLKEEAFQYINGFFSDEVGFLDGHGVSVENGGIPWEDSIRQIYFERYQEDICEKWRLLFEEGEDHQKVRYRYWQILTELLADNFYARLNKWCSQYGKKYTAHLKAEENLFFQIPYSGSTFWNLKNINLPAIDALERYPGNHYYPRIASSLSKQFYDGECLAEAIGGSGWGLSPEDMERYVDWLAESGITTFAFHIAQYKLDSPAVRDWPPSIPFGLNWKHVIKPLFGKLREKWNACGNDWKGVLLVAPTRAVMAEFIPQEAMVLNEHNGAGVPDSKAGRISNRFSDLAETCYWSGMEYDVTEERVLEHYGEIRENGLRLGNAVYHTVIFGQGCLWEQPEKAKKLLEKGIAVEGEEFSWKFVKAGKNQILLPKTDAAIPWRCKKIISDLSIYMLDMPEAVYVNGVDLGFEEENGKYLTRIPLEVIKKSYQSGELSIRIETTEKEPFIYLQGDFRVKNKRGYVEKDSRQLLGSPEFYLSDSAEEFDEEVDCSDFISSGYPFYKGSIKVKSSVFAGSNQKVVLPDVHGDCARVWVDDEYHGVIWGPQWEISGIEEGIHKIELELTANTFNAFGPHHHVDGDRGLVSPCQYSGERNFADRKDAPENTKIVQYHFRKFGIGKSLM